MTSGGMSTSGDGCGSELIGITSNNISHIPQMEQHPPLRLHVALSGEYLITHVESCVTEVKNEKSDYEYSVLFQCFVCG